METSDSHNTLSRGIRLGVSVAACIILVVASIVALNKAFGLMNQKSNFDFFLGISIIVALVAIYVPAVRVLYRRFLADDRKEGQGR